MERRGLAATVTAVAGAVSLLVTALVRIDQQGSSGGDAGAWVLLEPTLLAGLVFVVIRWSSPRAAAGAAALAAGGSALWVQRFVADQPVWAAAAASAVWLLPSLAAGGVGWYLRWAAAERTRAVATARTQQRLRLAEDLHDFVAHDISEIVARAQAGAAVLPMGDPRVGELLDQIETAGLRALDSMDRTVHALGDEDPAHAGGIDEIDGLVRRFATAGEVQAHVERRLDHPVDARAGAEAYRAVAEALTNVRRHAVRVTEVQVGLTAADGRLLVSVVDDGEGQRAPAPRPAAGLGLTAMTERAERLGGRVGSGPREPHGWQTTLDLPVSVEQGERT